MLVARLAPLWQAGTPFHTSAGDRCSKAHLSAQDCVWYQNIWRDRSKSQLVYGDGTIIAICIVIGIAAVVRVLGRRNLHARWYCRAQGLLRSTSYQTKRLPTLAYVIATAGLFVYCVIMTFAPSPLVWPTTSFGGSPPISVRSGYIALAFLPFELALAAKLNLISLVTGIHYERLQLCHQILGWAMLAVTLIHGVSMTVVRAQHDAISFEENHSWWTGIVAFAALLWLTLLSLPLVRRLCYSAFKWLHRIAAIVFVFHLFFHIAQMLRSLDVMVAALAIYLPSLALRIALIIWRRSELATVEQLGPSMLLVRRPAGSFKWSPGQRA